MIAKKLFEIDRTLLAHNKTIYVVTIDYHSWEYPARMKDNLSKFDVRECKIGKITQSNHFNMEVKSIKSRVPSGKAFIKLDISIKGDKFFCERGIFKTELEAIEGGRRMVKKASEYIIENMKREIDCIQSFLNNYDQEFPTNRYIFSNQHTNEGEIVEFGYKYTMGQRLDELRPND